MPKRFNWWLLRIGLVLPLGLLVRVLVWPMWMIVGLFGYCGTCGAGHTVRFDAWHPFGADPWDFLRHDIVCEEYGTGHYY